MHGRRKILMKLGVPLLQMGFQEYYRCMTATTPRPLAEILAAMTGKSDADIALVTKAYEFSRDAHKDQKRYSGDPYFTHPAEVGFLLATAGLGAEAIAAGLLHDTIEDAGVRPKDIEEQF